MRSLSPLAAALGIFLTAGVATHAADSAAPDGWLEWRGPSQDGHADATNLPDQWSEGGPNDLWTLDLAGAGTPVFARYADGTEQMVVWGFRGTGPDLVEVIAGVDPATGDVRWECEYADFISDIIYNRYSIGAPSIDPETGWAFVMTSPGLLVAIDRDGEEKWQVSMMETYGRLTFPNGRTGSPTIDGDWVVVNAITSNWGSEGPARNRFYAFDKKTGNLAWSSDPAVGPPLLKDSSFSTPTYETRNGRRLFYAGTGDGFVVAADARTGAPVWRYQMALGGVNASPVIYLGDPDTPDDDLLIQVHGKENVNDSGRGFMAAIKLQAVTDAALSSDEPLVLDDSHIVWRNNDVSMFTSSPTLVDGRVYQCTLEGNLVCIDAASGETVWSEKLATSQLHASPLFADGKLYVPMWNDGLFIVEPSDGGANVLAHIPLAGKSIGSPSVYRGVVYVHTTEKLYAIGQPQGDASVSAWPDDGEASGNETGQAVALRALPAEVLLRPGQSQGFDVVEIDGMGRGLNGVTGATWEKFIPPAARVRAEMNASFADGKLTADDALEPSAGAFKGTANGLSDVIRGRVLPSPPYAEDFEGFALDEADRAGEAFAYPPLPWIGARLKWEVRPDPTNPDNQVLSKTLDRVLFQRSTVFLGHADDAGYTVQADVMSDGNRRNKSAGGVVVQRYNVVLLGNAQQLEVSSNHERVKVAVPFKWDVKRWYTVKATVDVHDDGSGVVKAKAWPADDAEPADWTIEVPVSLAHTNGSPGLFGFSPQARLPVYLDNVKVYPNE